MRRRMFERGTARDVPNRRKKTPAAAAAQASGSSRERRRRRRRSVGWSYLSLAGLKEDDGHGDEEDLGLLLGEVILLRIPSCPIEEQPVDVAAVVGSLELFLGLPHDLEGPGEGIDRLLVLPREVLQGPGEEGLGEVEPREPEDGRSSVEDPGLEEVEAAEEVVVEGAEGLEGGVALATPQGGDRAVEEGDGHSLEVRGHHNDTLDGIEQLLQT
eukprot:750483-Hanusia_phi.AAC.1